MRIRLVCLAAALLLFASLAAGADYQPVPLLEGRIVDKANMLSGAERERLAALLSSYERETTHQIAVLTVPGLSGETIESFSLRVASSWQLGHRGFDNGILLALAVKERRIRIELGSGMESYISNAKAQSIIDTVMVPAFRKGDFAGGLQLALEELMKEARRFVVSPVQVKPSPQQ
jgi:uncharacterized protein